MISNISHYIDLVQRVVIIDNGSDLLEEDFPHKVHFIKNSENLGIAKAQNLGIAYCRTLSLDGLCIFFDQDSYLTSESLNRLLDDYVTNNNGGDIGLLAPGEKRQAQKLLSVSEVISSGSLIPQCVFNEVGNFREELFIDFVDYEFCWRLLKNGYTVYADRSVNLVHQTGKVDIRMGKIVSAPFRNYYGFRNLIYLESIGYNSISFKLKWLYRMFKRLVFELIFCPQKIKRGSYILRGIRDGILRRMGRLGGC